MIARLLRAELSGENSRIEKRGETHDDGTLAFGLLVLPISAYAAARNGCAIIWMLRPGLRETARSPASIASP
jgi:hypothetical protein